MSKLTTISLIDSNTLSFLNDQIPVSWRKLNCYKFDQQDSPLLHLPTGLITVETYTVFLQKVSISRQARADEAVRACQKFSYAVSCSCMKIQAIKILMKASMFGEGSLVEYVEKGSLYDGMGNVESSAAIFEEIPETFNI